MPVSATDLSGRGAAKVAHLVRSAIGEGTYRMGDYLPGVRQLARTYGVAPETARKAMKLLAGERCLSVHQRHGFRVTGLANDPAKAAPVAFVRFDASGEDGMTGTYGHLLAAFQAAAVARGWSVIGMSLSGKTDPEIRELLRATRLAGVILDSLDARMVALVREMGCPAVLADAWYPDSGMDAVIQDSFCGGLQAAEHLCSRGHRQIGWVGPLVDTNESLERWGGVMAGLRRRGLTIAPEFVVNTLAPGPEQAVRRMLARKGRPTGLVALWPPESHLAVRSAVEAGLIPGKDLEVVGWCTEEGYRQFTAELGGGAAPAAVTWSVRELAGRALAQLAERRSSPDAPPVRVVVPTRLRLPEGTG
jgi:DNA-binding LacI/PurR family transcriptional regulator